MSAERVKAAAIRVAGVSSALKVPQPPPKPLPGVMSNIRSDETVLNVADRDLQNDVTDCNKARSSTCGSHIPKNILPSLSPCRREGSETC